MSLSKKCTSVLLAFFLLFSNIGLALNVHFCGEEKITSQIVYSKTTEKPCNHEKPHHIHLEGECYLDALCCSSTPEDHSDCCKDEYISQDNSEVITSTIYSFNIDAFVVFDNELAFEFVEYSEDFKQDYLYYSYNSNAPPLYKLYCSLIYYA